MVILSAVELPDLLFGPSVDDLVHAMFVTPHAPVDGLPIQDIESIADDSDSVNYYELDASITEYEF
jgi:hypothetical protein